MKNMVDQPRFWLRKLDKRGLNPKFKSKTLNENEIVQENLLNWRKLVDLVENTELEKNFTLCLVRMHKLFHKNKQYQVPIILSSRYGDATLLKLILGQIDMVAKSTSMQIKDFLGTKAFDITPMCYAFASHQNCIEVVKLLMNYDENPNSPSNDGSTPIQMAAWDNHIEIVKLLMKSTGNLNAPMNDGTTPIFIAAQNNHIEIVKLLMKSTGNPNAPRSTDGATPIFMAAQNNHIEIVKLLMKATDNPNEPCNDGATPLSIATQKNHLEIVQLLSQKERDTPMEK